MRPATALLVLLEMTTLAPPLAGQGWEAVDRVLGQAVQKKVFPGAVVVIGRRDTVLYARGYGRVSWSKKAPRPRPDSTLWDLASLTKILATTSLAMVYVDRGVLRLDEAVSEYVPEFTGDGRDAITVRMLLDHTSGLRPWAPLWRQADTREAALAQLLREAPAPGQPPGTTAGYSDLNAILLGLVLERVGHARLDSLTTREVFQPLRLTDLGFGVRASDRQRTAPSRLQRRGRVVAGVVHDENARRLDGVAGHAGLFGSGLAVARFAQVWLGTGAGDPWVRPETMRLFLERSAGTSGRALGWNTPNGTGPTMFGALAPPEVVGHSGWTGTSLWLDRANDLFVVMLSNRSISPGGRRTLDAILDVRSEVADAARRAVLGTGGACAASATHGC